MELTMAQAAKMLRVSVSLIRHYEKEFQLKFSRTKGGQRVINERDLGNLRVIRSYRDQHLPIDEIRRQLAPVLSTMPEAGPEIKEVLAAIVARQDELERVVKLQQEMVQDLIAENRRFKVLGDRVQLLLEGPREPDPQFEALADQVAHLENAFGTEVSDLHELLEALQNAIAASPDENRENELQVIRERLASLEGFQDPSQAYFGGAALRELQEKLQSMEGAVGVRARTPSEEQVRGLHRRLLDLEAAFATRDELAREVEDEGLFDSLVSVIQTRSRGKQKPWWRLWGR